MISSTIFGAFLSLASMSLFASCTLPEDTCGPEYLIALFGLDPEWEIVTGDELRLEWGYALGCHADEFEVQLSTRGRFQLLETR